MNIHTKKVADLSTAHLTKADSEILGRGQCPGWLANPEFGHIVWLVWEDYADDLRKHGLSEDYIKLTATLRAAGFHYAWFDCDADVVEGLPRFDW